MKKLAAATALILLAACGDTPLRFDLPATEVAQRIPVSVGSVEVMDVSLPLYADQEVIYYEDETGALVSNEALLWADDPQRSFTEGLAFSLAAQTRATVAAEPWPFFDRPDVRVDVRVSRALPGRDGVFRLAGQYFVGSVQGETRERARRFSLSAPYQTLSAGSIASAKSRLIDELATLIARDGL
ncbi:PqiC family protein [Palleronia abyssalis]|uniref:ABC-type transport auxiliary lipoprotein component domain-containing protein n=1 Tax=Palleronia abyssalis TaxID=1501240 RepID=A0A2R8BUI2_9RHOB|nr:ABC-type transport auxiliary lipoprotein family protein [Palleronia abyssalis]SPJ23811.1 hypothetical protein PAA8504_01629 [Palleronia abyssalis]